MNQNNAYASQTFPKTPDSYYAEITSRNFHFISQESQLKLRSFRILIAGCGSTGGACIESLARVGVEHFALADNGEYEISNMNRQHVRLSGIGKNKAVFHKEELHQINPHIECTVESRGIQSDNVTELCHNIDLVFDAVDVTTPVGMNAKLALHREAHKRHLPVLSALDLGLRQWGMSFDYRNPKLEVLDGKHDKALRAKHPIKALFSIYPISSIPDHCIPLILDLLTGKANYASQLGCTSDLLSAIIVPVVLRFVETGDLLPGWSVDLSEMRWSQSNFTENNTCALRRDLEEALRRVD